MKNKIQNKILLNLKDLIDSFNNDAYNSSQNELINSFQRNIIVYNDNGSTVNPRTIYDIYNETRTNLRLDTLFKIAYSYNYNLSEFLYENFNHDKIFITRPSLCMNESNKFKMVQILKALLESSLCDSLINIGNELEMSNVKNFASKNNLLTLNSVVTLLVEKNLPELEIQSFFRSLHNEWEKVIEEC
ncbi:hypothetical protein ABID56_001575 [Alkalibacillus flavidus]|uniref:XRE family transcriptional regulator n=1 Tax=Alkalibacillus flavidus TaxID=546021 RepID=A0ABV2KV68_9BACI